MATLTSTRVLARTLTKFRSAAAVTAPNHGLNLQSSLPKLVQPSCVNFTKQCFSSRLHARDFSVSSALQARKFTKDHEWVDMTDNIATVGISDYAQDSLGDVVYVQLPEVGDKFQTEDEFGAIESVKAASDLICPVTGEVTEANTNLENEPELVNKSCYEKGWIIKLKVKDPSQLDGLMTEAQYDEFLKNMSES